MPFLSIIIPVYNAARWLDACLASIAAQPLSEVEVILVDDGSTDQSGAICARWAQTNEHFRLLQQANGGVGSARNRGMREAHGTYITFVDGDDVVSPDYVRQIRRAVEATGCDLLWWRCCFFEESPDFGGEQPGNIEPIEAKALLWEIVSEQGVCHGYSCNKAFRRTMLQDIAFDPRLRVWEDVQFCCQFFEAHMPTCRCVGLDRMLYGYRQHASSATHAFSPKQLDIIRVGTQVLAMLREMRFDEAQINAYANDLLRILCIYNKKLCLASFAGKREEMAMLDAVWRQLDGHVALDAQWSIKLKVYRWMQAVCCHYRSGRKSA